jgi:tRNA threonylcarbamoyladenosine biosynthesis protein TsaB
MKLLALDTSSDACTVAAEVDGALYEDHVVGAREHTKILMPMINRVLRDAGIELADLDAIVLGNGPGSFIGMRIGASVAQGLAFGAGKRIVPVSSLAAVAAEVFDENPDADRVIVTQDARMSGAYAGKFVAENGGVAARGDERIVPCHHEFADIEAFVAAGGGWQRYPELLTVNAARLKDESAVRLPRARFLVSLGASALAAGGAVDPEDLSPAYLRSKVAETPLKTR